MIHECIILTSAKLNNAQMHYRLPKRHPRELIEELRIARGFRSARALALAAGVKQPTLSRYLAGATSTMEVETFQAIASTLGVTVSELLGEVPLSQSGGVAREVFRTFQDLPEEDQSTLLLLGQALLQKRNPTD